MPDNFIPLILQNFHQLQRIRYTCDLLDQLCLFVSTYYHLHLSFPHQYPTRETSLKTTKQQPKIMNCVPKYDSFWQLWESSPNNPISTYVVTVVPRLSLLAKVSERNKENFVVHIYWSNLPKTVLCSAGVVFVGAEDSYTKSKNFYKLYNFGSKVSILRLSLEKNYVATKILFWWIHMISFIA